MIKNKNNILSWALLITGSCERDVAAALQRSDHGLLWPVWPHLLPPGLLHEGRLSSSRARRLQTSVTLATAAQHWHMNCPESCRALRETGLTVLTFPRDPDQKTPNRINNKTMLGHLMAIASKVLKVLVCDWDRNILTECFLHLRVSREMTITELVCQLILAGH